MSTASMITPVLVVTTAAPPGVEEARAQLRDELTRLEYVRVWWSLFVGWLRDRLSFPVGGADLGPVLTPLLVLLLVALATGLVALLLRRRRPEHRAPEQEGRLFTGATMSAEEYRRRAAEHLEAGRFDEALVDRFRAIATTAVDRTLVRSAPDLTAHEVGVTLAARFPGEAAAVRAADSAFAWVLYGGRRATRQEAVDTAALDERLRQAEPVETGVRMTAVPR